MKTNLAAFWKSLIKKNQDDWHFFKLLLPLSQSQGNGRSFKCVVISQPSIYDFFLFNVTATSVWTKLNTVHLSLSHSLDGDPFIGWVRIHIVSLIIVLSTHVVDCCYWYLQYMFVASLMVVLSTDICPLKIIVLLFINDKFMNSKMDVSWSW